MPLARHLYNYCGLALLSGRVEEESGGSLPLL